MNARTDWWGLARESLTSPRAAARAILNMKLSDLVLWEGMVLVAIVSVLMIFAEIYIGGGARGAFVVIAGAPLLMAAIQFATLVLTVAALAGIGRAFGGHGDWSGAMALVVWLQVIMLGFAAAQTVLYLLLPPLADMLGLLSIVVLLGLLTNFAAELHGFTNIWKVFAGVIGAGVVLILTISFLISLFLTGLPGGA
ncbi:Yip1 family protein [Solirhodobacter olei]|uniref:Yip1 family protein n=1 Tax=Solirhodobacter olei TaxID=2493082 RepID=UPI000FD6FCF5|nr:Yip1 family protein [Solirhodobacter olei]